jgi:flavin reductase (DIM6/NTAB) family NADH-FMN oxidoreductase RutF
VTVSEAVDLAVTPSRPFSDLARQFVTGVAVVTSGHADDAHGVTVSTLSLLSYRPALVSMVLRTGSHSVRVFEASGGFAISVLAARQARLARYFADVRRPPGMGPLGADDWQPGRNGPLLKGAISWLECRLEQVIPAGDHELVLAQVEGGSLHPGRPLVNFAGQLHADVFDSRDIDPPGITTQTRGGKRND